MYNKQFADNIAAQAAFDLAISSKNPLCILGPGGTGKSTWINALRKADRFLQLLAPTGVAAKNINGKTIHSFFGISPKQTFPVTGVSGFKESKGIKLIKAGIVKRILIDEISMVSAPLLDCVDLLLKSALKSKQPFGGLQIYFVGDPLQLDPIFNKADYANIRSSYGHPFPLFFESKAFKKCNPVLIPFTVNYRQKDTKFLESLNALRTGENIDQALALLNERCVGKKLDHSGAFTIELTLKNTDADMINQDYLSKIDSEPLFAEAYCEGRGWQEIEHMLIMETLEFKIGSQVMLLVNDETGQFVNGTMGKVSAFDGTEISMETEDGQNVIVGKHTWAHTDPKNEDNNFLIRQYPIRLANAFSIHKSQGLTFNEMKLVNSSDFFACGQLYVALNRCRSIDGLSLEQPLKKWDIKINKAALEFCRKAEKDTRYLQLIEDLNY